jgi:signal transduction histidine kinase
MFIASMSHELRTPLNSIIGFTGIILQGMAGEINKEQRDQLQRVSKAGKHLLALITDVIDISKIEAGKIEAYAEEFQIDSLLHDALSNLKLQIKEKGLEIEVSIVPDNIILRTDRKRLFQGVLNYLSNAVKFTGKGKITILAEEKGDIVQLSVTDTGIGIKEEDLPMLFQSFVRLDSPLKMTVTGTGLGLYLTKKLVTEVLGGEVSATSTYGKGSTFTLSIPKDLSNKQSKDLFQKEG